MKRASVLYITPALPDRHGNGLAMRAGLVLEGLARCFDVHLLVVPVAGDGVEESEFVRRHTVRVGSLNLSRCLDPHFGLITRVLNPEERFQAELAYPKPQLSRFCTGESARRVMEWAGAERIDAVYVMRLYLAPLTECFRRLSSSARPMCVLDLDDDEAPTRERMARLAAGSGDAGIATFEAAEAKNMPSWLERVPPGSFDRVTFVPRTMSPRLGVQFPEATFMVVPNGCPPLDFSRAGHCGGSATVAARGNLRVLCQPRCRIFSAVERFTCVMPT